MKQEELLKGIEEDDVLLAIQEELREATANAEDFPKKLEKRECELLDKIKDYHKYSQIIDTYDVDETENAALKIESMDDIAYKIFKLRQVRQRPWTSGSKYREAMAKYFTYITPILTDLEEAKQESRAKIAEIRERYNRELAEAQREFNTYENKVEELFEVAKETGSYRYQVSWEKQFGRTARSDSHAAHKAKEYSGSVIQEYKPTPKITKHQSLNGIQEFLAAFNFRR